MSDEIVTRNARIEHTMLGIEDHGIMTFMMYLDYGGSGQGFGGYSLDEPVKDGEKFLFRRGSAFGCHAIKKILEVVGVEKWEDLQGKHIRAKADYGKIHAIGNFLLDKWLTIEDVKNDFRV